MLMRSALIFMMAESLLSQQSVIQKIGFTFNVPIAKTAEVSGSTNISEPITSSSGGGWEIPQLFLKLSTGGTSLMISLEGVHCRSSSATVCAPPRVNQQEPGRKPKMTAAPAVLGSTLRGQVEIQVWLLLVSCLGLLSQSSRSSQMLLVGIP
ncbi:uncharacterized protein RBU33_019039 isoform 2-T2 [Hipposideros larvatus]